MEDDLYLKNVTHDDNKRTLSAVESIYHHMLLDHFPTSLAFTVYVLESHKPIHENLIRSCLHEESKKHLLLRARIRQNKAGYDEFQEMEDLDGNGNWINIECVEQSSSMSDLLKDSAKKPLDCYNGPLWRVMWISSLGSGGEMLYTLVLVSTHAITDGTCVADTVVSQMLPRLNNLLNNVTDDKTVEPSKSIQLTKSATELFSNHVAPRDSVIDFPVPFWKGKSLAFAFRLLSILKPSIKPPPMRVHSLKNEQGCAEFHLFKFTEETTGDLLNVCKNQSISMHSVLMLLLANAIKDAENIFPTFKARINEIRYPVDLRKFNKFLSATEPLPWGLYVNSITQKIQSHPVGDLSDFFRYCQSITKEVKSVNKPIGTSDLMENLIIMKRTNFFKDGVNYASQGILFSNLGNCDRFIRKRGNDVVQLTEFCHLSPTGNTIFVSSSTWNKKMFFGICYNSEWLNASFAKFVEQQMRLSIKTIIKGASLLSRKGRAVKGV